MSSVPAVSTRGKKIIADFETMDAMDAMDSVEWGRDQ